MPTKQKVLPIACLFGSATIWGLIWYPMRVLDAGGLAGAPAALLLYGVALALALLGFPHAARELRQHRRALVRIGLAAAWANLAFMLAVIEGEIIRVVLLFYLAPVWTVLLAHLLLQERWARQDLVIVGLSLAGAFTMLWHPGGGLPLPRNVSEWLGLSAGLAFAASNVLSRKYPAPSPAAKSISMSVFILILAAALILSDPAGAVVPDADLLGLIALVGLILFASSVMIQYGVARLPANQSVVIFLFELVVASLSAWWLAGEPLTLQSLAGGSLIVAACLYSVRRAS